MTMRIACCVLLLGSPFLLAGPARAQGDDPFPRADPATLKLDPADLQALESLVRAWVAEDELVGAELLVIHERATVLHVAAGWRDRERSEALQTGALFLSPALARGLTGLCVSQLAREERLGYDASVGTHLPSWKSDALGGITIEQLLHHRGGLAPESVEGPSLRAIADALAARGTTFPIGLESRASDAGVDVLGAVIEAVAGESLASCLEESLLDRVGASETRPLLDAAAAARAVSVYAGGKGAWTRVLDPRSGALPAYFAPSRGVWTSAIDVARVLALLIDLGKQGQQELLVQGQVTRALTLGTPAAGRTSGFAGLTQDQGDLWMLYQDPDRPKGRKLIAFGNDDRAGTHFWAFPRQDLIVVLLTSSRGEAMGERFERELHKRMVRGGDAIVEALDLPAEELERLLGTYWHTERSSYAAIALHGEVLALEVPGLGLFDLAPTGDPDIWKVATLQRVSLRFERDVLGQALAVQFKQGEQSSRFPRLPPARDLPTIDQLMALRKEQGDWERLAGLGDLRIRGSTTRGNAAGTLTNVVRGRAAYKSTIEFPSQKLQVAVADGAARTYSQRRGLETHSGIKAAQHVLDHPLVVVDDLRNWYAELEVLARLESADGSALLVRARPAGAHARAIFLDETTGRTLYEHCLLEAEDGRSYGSTVRYEDWRDVGGLAFPFRIVFTGGAGDKPTAIIERSAIETGVSLSDADLAIVETAQAGGR
jgi:CubicO group peptidase (beta-lactamase class C family)